MSKGLFVTATGTDVGKTYVTGLIVKLLREHGDNAGYYKGALSGAERIDGELIPGDSKAVSATAHLSADPKELVSYIYETAVSPHLAAQLENKPVELSVILSDFEKAKKSFDFITVEGSGGIVCPLRLDEQRIMLKDVIKLLQLAVLIVAPSELGTINSVVLTVEYARINDIHVKGIILNNYDEKNFLHRDNKKSIELLTKIPVITCVAENAADLVIDVNTLRGLFCEV